MNSCYLIRMATNAGSAGKMIEVGDDLVSPDDGER